MSKPDSLIDDYLVSYVINNNYWLILKQHNPPLLPVNNFGDPVLINKGTMGEFTCWVLFPMLSEVNVPVSTTDPDKRVICSD